MGKKLLCRLFVLGMMLWGNQTVLLAAGAGYEDETSQPEQEGDRVDPGETHTYIWEIQQDQGPTDGDSQCLTHSYSSNVNSVKDTNSGLIGALLVCRPGKGSTGWGRARYSPDLRGTKPKDAFQRLCGSGSVSCGQQQHFGGSALSPKSPLLMR